MCLLVYLGADVPLRAIPWDPAAPSFHVRPLTDDEGDLRRHFSLPSVYYVGSREKCGCAFEQDPDNEYLDEDEREVGKAARWELQAYLSGQMQRSDAPSRFEIYSRWSEHQHQDPESTMQGSVAEIHDRPDWFEDGTFLVLQS